MSDQDTSSAADPYVVVARRYRPQCFEDLIGQENIVRALVGAIESDRVGHAYLFTGARGVGKTSTARIFAKALNCQQGTSAHPCNECDICLSIAEGQDVDVMEYDGASNRGIDEIRQLRQNVNVRPSRGRYKIYIIDEVHMLTREAFNALLKTLEEPPAHVKFFFCTTEPGKIPVTILSRCQRFDFAGVNNSAIVQLLQKIVEAENLQAEPEALQLLARQAGGSLRDSQSLLEQLLAFTETTIKAEDVHALLGTAAGPVVRQLVGSIVERDTAGLLSATEEALEGGIEPGQLLGQVLSFFRDVMVSAAGCGPDHFFHLDPADVEAIQEAAKKYGIPQTLAGLQILEQALSRLRFAHAPKITAEMALVRLCTLEDLQGLSDLLGQLGSSDNAPTAPPVASANRSRPQATPTAPPSGNAPASSQAHSSAPQTAKADLAQPASSGTLTPENLPDIWPSVLERLSGMLQENLSQGTQVSYIDADKLAVTFDAAYTFGKEFCERPEQKKRLEDALRENVGSPVRVEFHVQPADSDASQPKKEPRRSARQRMLERSRHPLVSRAKELFNANETRYEEPGP